MNAHFASNALNPGHREWESMSVHGLKIRRPEYTGENRCLPCTAVNILIAMIASTLIGVWSMMYGIALFVIALALIYLRGYLVPGTPTLTKQYLPESVLRLFGKEPSFMPNQHATAIDPERVLMDAGAVSPCENGVDICLTPEFRAAWRERLYDSGKDVDDRDLRTALGNSEKTTFEEYSDATVVRNSEGVFGQWPSLAAKIADVTAAEELSHRYPRWTELDSKEKVRVLLSLRAFIEVCPDCGGEVRLGQEIVESCCQSYDVALAACEECDASLFEIEWQDEFALEQGSERVDGSLTA